MNDQQHLRFQDADELIEDAAESSNLDQSMGDPVPQPQEDSDDKTSADYYFDSYSHFGIFLIQKISPFSSGHACMHVLFHLH